MSDLFDVSKETILITDASQGRQFARVLFAHGAAVVLASELALHDRERGDGGWRVFVELRKSLHVIASAVDP
jgi:hypothetical protein